MWNRLFAGDAGQIDERQSERLMHRCVRRSLGNDFV
jgi:hypothetical protein